MAGKQTPTQPLTPLDVTHAARYLPATNATGNLLDLGINSTAHPLGVAPREGYLGLLKLFPWSCVSMAKQVWAGLFSRQAESATGVDTYMCAYATVSMPQLLLKLFHHPRQSHARPEHCVGPVINLMQAMCNH